MKDTCKNMFSSRTPERGSWWGIVACSALAAMLGQAVAAGAIPIPANCQVDPEGANDRPGQDDLTRFCIDHGDGAPWELYAMLNFDEIDLTGNNTMDACLLFDTDADAFANLAVCVTLQSSGTQNGNLTELQQIREFTCNDTGADRCKGSVPIPGPYDTVCEASHPLDSDPFSPAAPDGPGADYPLDTQVLCAIDLDDFGGLPGIPHMLDTCSYPSSVPNSDPNDCILFSKCSNAAECDDGNACTIDDCNASGVCTYTADSTGTCTDGLFCAGAEVCNALGFCESGGAPESCDDGIACTIDDCDELNDRCVNDPRNSLCDDQAFCTGVETCDPDVGCVDGPAPDCTDGVDCTVDSCNEDTNGCDHAASDVLCDDSAWCNGIERCDEVGGCMAGGAPDCDDDVACTIDSCNEASDSCSHATGDAACSDDLFCNGAETCTPTGCAAGTPPDCNDGVGCTTDSCVEAADLCLNVPGNSGCDDGQYCTGVEICDPTNGCQGGTDPCIGPATCDEIHDECIGCTTDIECDNGVYCDGTESCDETTATCAPGAAVVCDDGISCTIDSCDEAAGACANLPADAYCDNGLYCDGAEACSPTGCMAGDAPVCDDGIACTVDSCVEATDACSHAPDDARCDNGIYCDGAETCSAPIGCDDGVEITCPGDSYNCSIESCNEATDECESDFSRCACGDLEIVGLEQCEPPRAAGSFEDCNNGIDDNNNDEIDCKDPECKPGSGRGLICTDGCTLDAICSAVGSDPALIKFNRKGGHDSMWMHGQFPVEIEPDPRIEGFTIEISNGVQPIYAATLVAGDFEGNAADAERFRFRDRDARELGGESSRDGLETVSLAYRTLNGVRVLAFRVRAYGDFSAATHRVMSSQVTVGGEVAALTAEWGAKRGRWYLRQRDY